MIYYTESTEEAESVALEKWACQIASPNVTFFTNLCAFRYIDDGCVCPGGNLLWNLTEPMSSKTQLCEGQLNTCKYLNGKKL